MAERVKSTEKSSDLIGIRTHNLLACNIVPQTCADSNYRKNDLLQNHIFLHQKLEFLLLAHQRCSDLKEHIDTIFNHKFSDRELQFFTVDVTHSVKYVPKYNVANFFLRSVLPLFLTCLIPSDS
jgi:hypothetical protein